jgi:phosphoribosylamine--glycine ligase
MKVLIIGNGGREHAIAWKLNQSPLVFKIYCCPGNAGTAQIGENIRVDCNVIEDIADFVEQNKVDLTIVGPEAYLAQGTVDYFKMRGLNVYGPTQAAARLESSKSMAKEFMFKYNIPTAKSQTFTQPEAAKDYIRQTGIPLVIKADGLAAGKGVTVAFDLETALKAIDDCMVAKLFGESGTTVIIEEYLEGEEASLLAFSDGDLAVPMLPVQDHKRIGDGDTGPNTGGMGTYAPTTAFTPEIRERVVNEILNPTIQGMKAEGNPFVGTLFIGLMLTPNGPKVVEYNVRFGDPETQVVLPLLESDLAQIFNDCVSGRLNPDSIKWKKGTTAVCVVAASGGYPGTYQTGKPIDGLEKNNNSLVFHAGTKFNFNGDIVTAGGRVLNVVHLGNNIQDAINGAYRDLDLLSFEDMYYRKDIGRRELLRSEK